MLTVTYADCRHAEKHYAECHYTECYGDQKIMSSMLLPKNKFFFNITPTHPPPTTDPNSWGRAVAKL